MTLTNGSVPPPMPDMSDLFATDAQTLLARRLVEASVSLSGPALRTYMFMGMYAGSRGEELARQALKLKVHQTPGVVKKISDAIQSISLKEFMSKINISLGGK